jgi:hypothetical protein
MWQDNSGDYVGLTHSDFTDGTNIWRYCSHGGIVLFLVRWAHTERVLFLTQLIYSN